MFRSMCCVCFGVEVYVCKVYIGDASSIPKEQASGYHQMTKKRRRFGGGAAGGTISEAKA